VHQSGDGWSCVRVTRLQLGINSRRSIGWPLINSHPQGSQTPRIPNPRDPAPRDPKPWDPKPWDPKPPGPCQAHAAAGV